MRRIRWFPNRSYQRMRGEKEIAVLKMSVRPKGGEARRFPDDPNCRGEKGWTGDAAQGTEVFISPKRTGRTDYQKNSRGVNITTSERVATTREGEGFRRRKE